MCWIQQNKSKKRERQHTVWLLSCLFLLRDRLLDRYIHIDSFIVQPYATFMSIPWNRYGTTKSFHGHEHLQQISWHLDSSWPFYQFPTDLLILVYIAKHQIIASVKVGESYIHFLNNTKGPGPNRRKLLPWLLLCVWKNDKEVSLPWATGVSPRSFRKHPRRRPSVLPSLQWLLCVLSDTDITATPLCGCCVVQHGGGGGDCSENERILLTQRRQRFGSLSTSRLSVFAWKRVKTVNAADR